MKKLILFIIILHTFQANSQVSNEKITYSDSLFNEVSLDRNIDVNLPVGRIEGNASVEDGNASYNIPITVPPGTNGFGPTINIHYSSGTGVGICGRGWSLSSVNSIIRVGKDRYHDNEQKAVKLNNTDNYMIDGSRLILISGTYGADQATYRTESESFVKITSFGSLGGCPTSFKVETQAGITYEYGGALSSGDINSRLYAENNSVVIQWMLSKMYDNFGNYIEFVYDQKNDNYSRRILLTQIKYTGNTSMSLLPYNTIDFSYKKRDDAEISYVAGRPIFSEHILENIVVKCEGVNMMKYEFTYGKNKVQSFLKELKQYGFDNSVNINNWVALNSHRFQYGNLFDSYNTYNFQNENITNGLFDGTADFNGDGFIDLLRYQPGSLQTVMSVFINKGNGMGQFEMFNKEAEYVISPIYALKSKGSSLKLQKSMFGDFNGDGRDDILMRDETVLNFNTKLNSHSKIYFRNTSNNGFTISNNYNSTTNPSFNRFTSKNNYNNFLWIGDFDGDGRDDILTILSNGSEFRAWIRYNGLQDIKQVKNIELNGLNFNFIGDANHIIPGDFDADGKADLFIINESSAKIFTFENFGGTEINGIKVADVSGYDYKMTCMPGDYNGDGKTDLIKIAEPFYLPEVRLSNGQGNFIQEWSIGQPPPGGENVKIKMESSDINGDGLSDLIYVWTSKFVQNLTEIRIYFSTGTKFVEKGFWNFLPYAKAEQAIIADFNGTGTHDLIYPELDNETKLHYFDFKYGETNNLLIKVLDGFNAITKFNYRNLTEKSSPIYTESGTFNYPLTRVRLPYFVVSSLEYSNGIGGINSYSYDYENLLVHKGGRGFLGFLKKRSINNATGIRNTDEFNINTSNNLYLLELVRSQSHHVPSNSLLSKAEYSFEYSLYNNSRFWSKVKTIKNWDYLNGTYKINTINYDLHGNVLNNNDQLFKIYKECGACPEIQALQTTVDINNSYNSTLYGTPYPAHPSDITVSTTRVGESPFTKATHYTYFGSTEDGFGLPKKVDEFYDKLKQITQEWTYFKSGNVKTNKLSAPLSVSPLPVLEPRQNSYDYDTKFRFVNKETNAINQEMLYSYNPKWGKVAQRTNLNSKLDNYSYDIFGRLISESIQDGLTVNTMQFNWDIKTPANAGLTTHVYKITRSGTSFPNAVEWFDIYGRSVKSANINNFTPLTTLYSENIFNNKGELIKKVLPYYTGQTPMQENFSYDSYGRIQSKSLDGLPSQTYVYSPLNEEGNLVQVTNSSGIVSKTWRDANGNDIKIEDPGGIVLKSYYSHGGEKSITNNFNGVSTVVQSLLYDEYGRLKEETDKNAGLTKYEYNAYGELYKKTDANNVQYIYSYDKLGRRVSIIGPEITTFNYVQSGLNGVNQVSSIYYKSQLDFSYTYDVYGRIQNENKYIDNQAFTTSYTYNNLNLIETVTYPDNFGLKYEYQDKLFKKILNKNDLTKVYFELKRNDRYGNQSEYILGNGLTTTKTYNAWGYPESFNTPNIQNYSMSYNANNGNLIYRKDLLTSKQEDFTYDDMERLKSAKVNSLSNTNYYNFENGGNISSFQNAGTFTYFPTQWNAVKKVTNPTGIIPSAFQNIIYNNLERPIQILEGINTYDIQYSYNQERNKTVLKENGVVKQTKYYVGNYEKLILNNITYHIHYIHSGGFLTGMVVTVGSVTNYYAVYTDHLGSIYKITTASGVVVAEYNYDAWGRRRNPTTWDYAGVSIPLPWQQRGYTGHEHLDPFVLINMNARLYDPILGRMLSPDAYNAGNFASQSFNKYTYAGNNPLKYTDPSGNLLVTQNDFDYERLQSGMNTINSVYASFGLARSMLHSSISGMAGGMVGNNEGTNGTPHDKSINSFENRFNNYSSTAFNLNLLNSQKNITDEKNKNTDGGTPECPECKGSMMLPEVTITAKKTYYQSKVDKFLDRSDFFSGIGVFIPGSFRFRNGLYNGNNFSFKYYSSGWRGGSRALISTFRINKIGLAASSTFFVLGTINDGIGVYNYYQNPSVLNPNAVHPGKAGLNLGVSIYGMYINPIPALLYGGLEAFYPNGMAGALNMQSNIIDQNRLIYPYFQLYLPKL